MDVFENEEVKILRSEAYNYNFVKASGYFERWGETEEDDPQLSVFGPEIIDMEITTICNGIGNYGPCSFCYKANTKNGIYMSFSQFKRIFDKLPKTVTQIAFGLDAKCESSPDTFKIMEYSRDRGVVPNVTVADISDETAVKLSKVCGAVAVSRYHDKDICYDTVKRLTGNGLDQVNIHAMISKETLDQTYELFNDYFIDSRLKGIKAIVMLSLKQKGRGEKYNPLTQQEFDDLVNFAMKKGIPIGFDSCSAPKLMNAIKDKSNREEIEQSIEPCESSLFSVYCDVHGNFYPCSFCEEVESSFTLENNFLNDVWNPMQGFRQKLLSNNRACPVFNV